MSNREIAKELDEALRRAKIALKRKTPKGQGLIRYRISRGE